MSRKQAERRKRAPSDRQEGSARKGRQQEAPASLRTGDADIGYAAALAELGGLLDELEGEAVDIDRLAERVLAPRR